MPAPGCPRVKGRSSLLSGALIEKAAVRCNSLQLQLGILRSLESFLTLLVEKVHRFHHVQRSAIEISAIDES